MAIPQTVDVIKARYQTAMDKMVSEDTVLNAMQETGLNQHDTTTLYDTCGSLSNIAKCGVKELLDKTTLDKNSATALVNFLSLQN